MRRIYFTMDGKPYYALTLGEVIRAAHNTGAVIEEKTRLEAITAARMRKKNGLQEESIVDRYEKPVNYTETAIWNGVREYYEE